MISNVCDVPPPVEEVSNAVEVDFSACQAERRKKERHSCKYLSSSALLLLWRHLLRILCLGLVVLLFWLRRVLVLLFSPNIRLRRLRGLGLLLIGVIRALGFLAGVWGGLHCGHQT